MSLQRFSFLGAGWHVEPQVDDVRGFQVFDSAGKFVGIVDDLLVNKGDDSTIDYVLVGQGNIATMFSGTNLIVPLNRLAIDSNNKSVRLDVALDQLWDFPSYSMLDDPDLKDKIDSFWATVASAPPFRHDMTVSHPSTLESPPPIPPKVEPSKMVAGNPRIAAGLESPIRQSVIDHALEKVAEREGKAPEEAVVKKFKPRVKEEKPEKPAA